MLQILGVIIAQSSQPVNTPTDFPFWGNVGVVAGCLGLLGYVLKVTLPQIVKEFRDDTKMQREAYTSQMESAQKLFSDELGRERDLSQRREATWRETLLHIMRGNFTNTPDAG